MSIGSCAAEPGSSPLTRGKPSGGERFPLGRRLIPAHAGKTLHLTRPCPYGGAHPRSRGENMPMRASRSASEGSSPLTRGKQSCAVARVNPGRLIPAHAGKTYRMRPSTSGGWAHPRSRGENISKSVRASSAPGSSPLTRGKPGRVARGMRARGLIPAHAGKTIHIPPSRRIRGAHPRSRGENLEDNWEVLEADGSSPLTRGKRSCRDRLRRRGRLIPAHAGKTPPTRRTRRWPRAHPRSRGENKRMSCADHDHWGSSPLTRGKRAGRYVLQWPARLIPAHAGKTGACMRRPRQRRAHPRSRGENASWSSVCLLLRGSSPLTRGKHHGFDRLGNRRGLIPAHAGKTAGSGSA